MHFLQPQVESLMRRNQRTSNGYQYTVPSPELYPFQWLWDSCFHAIIYSHFDIPAAKAELRSALSHPLESGLLPHIIYWERETVITNWGREMRGDVIDGAWGVQDTSSITQPPMMALAAWRIHEIESATAFLREIYPVLSRHHKHLLTDRVLSSCGLAFIINPDESGEDNSPRFDAAQGLPPHHTADQNLDRRIKRIREHAACDFRARECTANHFAVSDGPFNILLAESLTYMSKIATVIDEQEDATFFATASERITNAIRTYLWQDGAFMSLDHNSGENITIDTWAQFMPLYGGILDAPAAKTLVEDVLLDPERFGTRFPIPTTSKTEPSFDPVEGFWRGPVWIAPNWFVYHGLKRYGFDDAAAALKQKTEALITDSGFREQYNPLTGAGIGARGFTWGGLVLDMM